MYFQNFPKTYYTLSNVETVQVVTDITRRIDLVNEIKKNNAFFDSYDVIDGETPEIVADKFYNDPELYWVILTANDILDPRFEWPLSYVNLLNYCENKYGAANVYLTHHYQNSDGYVVNSSAATAVSVSNFDFESTVNEDKRRIKIPKQEIVAELQTVFENLINK